MVYLIVFVLILLPMIGLGYLSLTSPVPDIPGEVEGKLPACPSSPNCVCSFDSDELHSIEPLEYVGDSTEVFSGLVAQIQDLSGAQLKTLEKNYAHFEFTSMVFRFVDDVELLLIPEEKRIHIRSASRAGHSDLGVNRKRVEQIRTLLSKK